MLETHFHLTRRPFSALPEIASYYPAASAEEARQTLTRIIERDAGPGLLIGPSGTGKSLVCALLADRFRDELEVAHLAGAPLATRRALLQAILFELRLPFRGMDEGELRLNLIDHLTRRNAAGRGILLIVDESQAMSVRLLEELRLITNIVRQGEPRVRLILAGGPVLEERFATPQLESFSQRIAARCYLQHFAHADTLGYVAQHLQRCGGDSAAMFTPDALDALHRASDGIPRLINQICDHALLLAAASGVARLDARHIEEAWADLQQLPTPWRDAPQERAGEVRSAEGEVIEFAGLDEELDELLDGGPSAVTFELESDFSETVDQLDQLERQVVEMTDEFRPAGTIRPEVEFVLPACVPAASHSFDEEEVVLDHYASLDAGCWAGRPQVASREGRELGRLLDRFVKAGSGGEPVQPTTEKQPTAQRERPTEPLVSVPIGVASQVEVAAASDVEPDLIVVEDDPVVSVPLGERPIVPVRRQEYRQLFSRLRRG